MADHERIVSVVLAAGAGRRFGGHKQLAPLRGRPLLQHALAGAAATGTDETVLVLGAFADEIRAGVDLRDTTVVLCADWQRGRHASLRAGLRALGESVVAAVVTLGDEPFLGPTAGQRLIAARAPELPALRATYDGEIGHPVLIERRLFAPLTATGVGTDPAAALRGAGVRLVECGDLGRPADVDTIEQLAALEAQPQPRPT